MTTIPMARTTPTTAARDAAQPEAPSHRAGPLLVAVAGSRTDAALLCVAAALAARDGLAVETVTVDPYVRGDVHGFSLKPASLDSPSLTAGSPLGRVRAELLVERAAPVDTLHVEFGNVPQAIARVAATVHAPMILIGLSGHLPARRLFSRETAARVLRYAGVPVLAVEARTRTLPRVAVVGVDFGASSWRAARAALTVLDRPARLILAHVRSMLPTTETDGTGAIYDAGVRAEFERMEAALRGDGVTVQTVVLDGEHPAEAIDTLARRERAELVAVGSHGRDFVARVLIGSVPSQLLRSSERSVLVAPSGLDGFESNADFR